MVAYDTDWVAQQLIAIDKFDVPEPVRDAMRDAVLDTMNPLNLAAHYQQVGCPLCGDHNVAEHEHMVLCNGCGRRVA